MNESEIDTSFIPDHPRGPLDSYRNRATFDWKKLRIIFEDPNLLRVKYKLWEALEMDPLFETPKKTLSADEQKRIAALQMRRLKDYDFVPPEIYNGSYKKRTRFLFGINEAMQAVSPSLSVKIALGVGLLKNALIAMGTERHQHYFDMAWNREIVCCLAITEVAHGSNTKRIQTTATYDPKTEEFVIHTPDFRAAKCWVGNLGKTGTVAITFANLYTADGTNHGLHGFLVPIRDPKTMTAYPGVLVGDMGDKIGLNGIDNGFVMFSHYRIPRENLLNRTGDVTPDGEYESVFTEPEKVLGAALESLSAGRLGIMQEATVTLSQAVVIAVRYAALRTQFGPEKNGPEQPIIEYQLHQWRVFPYLATACILRVANYELSDTYLSTVEKSQANSNGFELLTQSVSEIHALVCSSKAYFTWVTRDALQEVREACGGHGYLRAANIGEMRNNHDPTLTYEGDNNVLNQQASNWLLRQWKDAAESPMGTTNFMKRKNEILSTNFDSLKRQNSITSVDFVIECYEWLLCYLLNITANSIKLSLEAGQNLFEARNNAQVYKARELSYAYAEYYSLLCFKNRYQQPGVDHKLYDVLEKIFRVYGFWAIDKHMATFYQGSFATGPSFGEFVREQLLTTCLAIKDNAVSIADSLAPPDFVLKSVIAKSDGKLYEHLQNEFMTNPGAMERATWWNEILSTKSKL